MTTYVACFSTLQVSTLKPHLVAEEVVEFLTRLGRNATNKCIEAVRLIEREG